MGKFAVGDKVKIISNPNAGFQPGTVATISIDKGDDLYELVGDYMPGRYMHLLHFADEIELWKEELDGIS